ncbi:MAG: hypothetical protein P4L99_27990 [Chthoniobacter sp.]|nr:hypothetical protein [Chthoniobacter sp.]
MRDWKVKVINPAPENLAGELEITARGIGDAIALTRESWPDGFIYSVVAKKPNAEEIKAP